MTLREYIDQLQAFANDNPEALDLAVITATDEEGNGYMPKLRK